MKHSFYISVLTSLFVTMGCSSVSQNIEPVNANTAVSSDENDMAADDLDEMTETEEYDSTEASENSDADAPVTNDEAASDTDDQSNSSTDSPARDDVQSQPFSMPICDFWRHSYGTDSEMTDNTCRLSDEAVESLIQSGGDINQWNDYGQTPIMLADSAKAIKALIEAGADVNHADEFGKTALDYARTGEIVDLIVKAPGFSAHAPSLNPITTHADVAMALEKHGLLSLTIDNDFFLFKKALNENSLSGIKHYLDKILYSEQDADKASALSNLNEAFPIDTDAAAANEKRKGNTPAKENSHNRQLAADVIQNFLSPSTTAPIVEYLLKKGFSMKLCPLSNPKAIAKLAKAGADKWCGGQDMAISKTSSIKKLFELVDDDAKGIFAKRILLNSGNTKLVQYILDHKEKIPSLTQDDMTSALLNTKSDAIAKSLSKSAVLGNISASQINNSIVLSHYLEHGGDVNASALIDKNTSGTLLNRAISLENPKMVKILLEAGANVRQADQFEKGSVDQALSSDSKDSTKIAKLLIQAGANVSIETIGTPFEPWDEREQSPLLNRAIESDDTELVEMMLLNAKTFSPDEQNVWRYISSYRMFKFLLNKGFIANAKTWEEMLNHDNPDVSIPQISRKELKQIAKVLKPMILSEFKAHPAPDQESHRDWLIWTMDTYLTEDTDKSTSDSNNAERHIMSYNNTTSSDGDDATGHWTRNSSILRDWLARGGDPNKRDAEGKTPLMFADFANEIQILVAAGADVNAKDNSGNTVLMVQIQSFPDRCLPYSQSRSIVEVLIQAGADIHATNAEGKTALDIYNSVAKHAESCISDLKLLLTP